MFVLLTRCVEPIEFIQRPAGQGLGATLKIDDASKPKRRLKPGEDPRKVLPLFVTVKC